MDADDLERIGKVIDAALREHNAGMVPFSWVATIVGGLVTGIGATWAWGVNQSKKAASQIAEWAAKVEELSDKQRSRDDSREAEIRDRYAAVIQQMREDAETIRARRDDREQRLEAARDAARQAYENLLRETGEVLGAKLQRSTQSEREVADALELILPLLEELLEDRKEETS